MDKDKKSHGHSTSPTQPVSTPELDEFFRKLKPEMRRPKPSPDAVAAALESAQRLATENDAEQAAEDAAQHLADNRKSLARKTSIDDSIDDSPDDSPDNVAIIVCGLCGHRNRATNRFCGMCGVVIEGGAAAREDVGQPRRERESAIYSDAFAGPDPESEVQANSAAVPRSANVQRPATDPGMRERHANGGPEAHHYHHHYHHHYFPGGQEGAASGMGSGASSGYAPRAADPGRDPERLRPTAALRGDMSRAEAAVRRIAQEWVMACNTKHLDDLLELYAADPLVLRSNLPPIRGAAAVREYLFGALDSGLGEVELEPLRVDVIGDLAYEAGRCKALVPSANGKRREERGKYLWVCTRQPGGEWKLTADCWSSDLTLNTLESDVPPSAGVKVTPPRKS